MAAQDKKKFKTVPAMDMDEYRQKLRAHRLGVMKRTFAVTLIVLAIAAGLGLYMALRHYEDFDVTATAERSDTAAASYGEFAGNILKYTNDGALYTNADNERIWNQTYEMAEPAVDICEGYLAIYDKKGTQIYILTPEGLAGSVETTMAIRQVSVAAQGTVAVLMGDDAASYLVLYDKNGNELVNGAIYGENGGYPVAISLSHDAVKLAVSMLDIGDGSVRTTIAFYNFGSVGENEIDRIVSASSFSDMVIPELDFVSDDKMIAYGDSEIAVFEGTQKPELTQEIALDGEAKSIFHDDTHIGVIYNGTGELANRILVYDMRGNIVMEKEFSLEYTDAEFLTNGEVCIRNAHSCDIYTVRGIYKFHYDFDGTLCKVISGGTGLNYTILLEGVTEKIRLK